MIIPWDGHHTKSVHGKCHTLDAIRPFPGRLCRVASIRLKKEFYILEQLNYECKK